MCENLREKKIPPNHPSVVLQSRFALSFKKVINCYGLKNEIFAEKKYNEI